MRWTLTLLAALALLAAGCGEEDAGTILEDGADSVELGDDSDVAGDDATTAPDDGDTTDAQDDDDQPTDPDAATQAPANSSDAIDVRSDHPVEARPGRWAVGEAGFVEWDLVDGDLVLVDVEEADGWSARVDDEDSDEIEVDFRRDNTEMTIEIERDDGRLEVDIEADIEPADAGVYELGRAGSVEFGVDGGRLELADVVVADGWELVMDEESADEIEFTLRSDQERYQVEIELDDGEIEVEIDYRVRTSRSG